MGSKEQCVGVKQPDLVWKTRDCSMILPYICRKVLRCDDENCLRCVYPNKCRRCKRGYTLNLDNYSCVEVCTDTYTDYATSCAGYKDKGYCDIYQEWMKLNCKRTCGFCLD